MYCDVNNLQESAMTHIHALTLCSPMIATVGPQLRGLRVAPGVTLQLLLFQMDWKRPVSPKTLGGNFYHIHKDYIFQVWITLGEWFSNLNHQGDH